MRHRIRERIRKTMNRSGMASCDVCSKTSFLIVHHINGRDVPDYNGDWNRAVICPNCHTGTHYGEIIIEQWVMTSNGKELLWHRAKEPSFSGTDAKPYIV
jgi:hypothetical protein